MSAPVGQGHAGGMFDWEIRHVLDVIHGRARPAVTPQDAVMALRIALAVARVAPWLRERRGTRLISGGQRELRAAEEGETLPRGLGRHPGVPHLGGAAAVDQGGLAAEHSSVRVPRTFTSSSIIVKPRPSASALATVP